MAEKDQVMATKVADAPKLDEADRLTQACESAAVSVETALTPRQIVAAILRKIPIDSAAPIHPSRRAEVAALVAQYESRMRDCAEDAGRLKLAHELTEKIRLGGFRMAADSTQAGFAQREKMANGIRSALASLGWNAKEIEQAFVLAGHDERAFGNLSWDYVVIDGKQMDRRPIQLAGKPAWTPESDDEWLGRNFPRIQPPKPEPKPLWMI